MGYKFFVDFVKFCISISLLFFQGGGRFPAQALLIVASDWPIY